jgi:YD repeat-containing protein
MHRSASAPRARLVHLLVCLSLLAQSLIPQAASAESTAGKTGKPAAPAGTAAARQEAEAADLPDLEEVRRRPQHEPKAVPPVPSTRRRCPPRNPRCNQDVDGAPQATPTPAPPAGRPGRHNPHAASADAPTPGASTLPEGGGRREVATAASASYFALLTTATNGARPWLDPSLLDFITSDGAYAVSDSGRPLFAAAAAAFQGAANLAQGKPTAQSSTLVYNPPGDASHAVDGNTDGNYFAGSVTHTNTDNQPWWQVDLGAVQSVGAIHLWNRTDCCQDRLANYYVFVSDAPFASTDPAQTQAQAGVWTSYNAGQAPTHATLTANRAGRYVRVQLAGTGILSLAEVQVFAGEPQAVPSQGIPPAESVAWTNAGGVTVSGSRLTKVGATGWGDAGAMSTKAIASGDGYVEFTASETNTYRMLGLSHGDSNRDYTDIDFAIYPAADGQLYVYEAGVGRGGFGPYATGDRLRVSVASGVVSYSKNGTTVYTSAAPPRSPLLVDAAIYNTGATINNVVISGALVENVVWANAAGVTPWANNLTKDGSVGWNGGASSTRVIAGGDGYAEFTVLETNTPRMFGLSRGDSNQIYTDIDYAIYPYSDGTLHVYEAGEYKAYLGGYAAGDRLRVSVEGGQVRYRRNGALLYTSGTPPQYPLLVDTSLHDPGATIHNAVISAPLPSQTDPGGTGLTGRYYDNIDFTNYVTTRLDYTVNYWWDLAAPAPGVGSEEFSVRWTGMVVPRYSEEYTFYTTSDDGVRLWVDGQLIIDKWFDQGATEWSGKITLEAGRQYSIKMEFYDRFWGAVAQLRWSSLSQAKEIVPQSRLLPCWKPVEQFVRDFYQAVLRRAPSSYELQDWTERLTQAQGEGQQIAAAQALGRTLFGPTGAGAEYYALNPTDTPRFVSDLYWGFLQRAPDAGGFNWWLGAMQSREHGINSFADSIEFKDKVARLCGTAAASGTNGGVGYNFAAARLDPSNRTGGEGADPYSRNYKFSIPLVSLPGRAGLDLGLALAYNSLVWTKEGTGVTFDADRGTPSPGFRLGFPTLQPKFYNPQTQKNAYLLVTPSGARVELRQVGASNVYESADSSYLQLTEGDMTLRSTDGTQLGFTSAGGEWRCYLMKDRNGNYISAAYYGDGRILSVTDTLGRVLTFNYDNYQNLLSITQPWRRETEANPSPAQDETHQWATFGYGNVTLQPQFSNLAVVGEQPGTVIPALTQVGLADGSYYKFSYNQWGQVWKATRYAADSVGANGQPNDAHPLTSTRLNLPGSDLQGATAQADCPRFTEERAWVENGVMNQSGEVTTSYDAWSPNMTSCQVTAPDGTKKINHYGGVYPWQKGLVTIEESRTVGGLVMKATTFTWEHDGTAAASYPTNVRLTQSLVEDDKGNHQLTRFNFTSTFGLPREVIEYKPDNTTALRRTEIDYRIDPVADAAYLNLRLIGLVKEKRVYGLDPATNTEKLYSKSDYRYDWGTVNNVSYLQQQGSPVQHDNTGYGQNFLVGRANLTSVRRFDATSPTIDSLAAEFTFGYNTDGSVIFEQDPSGHRETFAYDDKFWSPTNAPGEINRNTFAYPTRVTNPDGYTASSEYIYGMGVLRESRTPLPNALPDGSIPDLPGPVRRGYYDGAGRPVKTLTVDNGAYTRWVYPAKMDVVQTFTLVEPGKESYTAQVLDGAGRVRATASNLPFSSGGYSGQFFDYDSMGRLARQSNPTATTAAGAWPATDEDAANGWLYTQTTYDWKGRPLLITNPGSPATTKEFVYGGCGCAGGEVVTTRDEVGRRVRVTHDSLGRAWKTQVLSQQPDKPQPFTDGPNETVYSMTTNTYDALDHVTQVVTQAASSGVTQTATMGYDGHGRISSRKEPEATVATSYTYYDDDTLRTVTDGRGVLTTYEYNGRHQRRKLKYDLPSNPDPAFHLESAATVNLQYDGAGNRLWMTDGLGRVDYEYDAVSQLTAERRNFAALNRTYRMVYDYNKVGQLTYVFDSFNGDFSYQRDAAGRLTDVTSSPYGGTTSYVSNVRYRAGGGVKSASYSNNGLSSTTEYDARLRPWKYRLTDSGSGAFLMREDFTYYADSRLAVLTDLNDTAGPTPPSTLRFLSRSYGYDLLGRVTGSAGSGNGGGNLPLNQSYSYDEFGNLTSRTGSYYNWGCCGATPALTDTATYTNNRRDGWSYDPDGRYTANPASASNTARNAYHDAAGRQTKTVETRPGFGGGPTTTFTATAAYDGDGRVVYETTFDTVGTGIFKSTYTLRAAALGGEPLTTLNSSGNKETTHVPAGGLVFARQTTAGGPFVAFTMRDPVGVTESNRGIYDPLGNYIPFRQPADPRPAPGSFSSASMSGLSGGLSNPDSYGNACFLDGVPANCRAAARMVNHGAAYLDNINGLAPFSGGGGSIPTADPPDKTVPGPDEPTNPGSLEPHYDGGTTYGYVSVQFFFSPGAQQTTTTNPQTTGIQGKKEFNEELEKFLKKNSNCLKKVQAKGKELGLGDYQQVLAQTPIYDGSDMNVYNAKGFAGKPNRTLGDFNRENPTAHGVTTKDGIYVTATMVWRSVAERSITLFHESLHRYFFDRHTKPEHVWLANQFGFKLLDMDRKKYPDMTDEQFNDYRASRSLNAWIKNGCK